MSGDLQTVAPASAGLAATLAVPGDKSIGHRAVLLGAAARGTTRVRGLPDGADVRSSLSVARALGATVTEGPEAVSIDGVGGRFHAPAGLLEGCGVDHVPEPGDIRPQPRAALRAIPALIRAVAAVFEDAVPCAARAPEAANT